MKRSHFLGIFITRSFVWGTEKDGSKISALPWNLLQQKGRVALYWAGIWTTFSFKNLFQSFTKQKALIKAQLRCLFEEFRNCAVSVKHLISAAVLIRVNTVYILRSPLLCSSSPNHNTEILVCISMQLPSSLYWHHSTRSYLLLCSVNSL